MRVKLRGQASHLLLAALLAAAGPAGAQDYPSGIEAEPLSAWLEKSTNIDPTAVVSVTSELVVAIVGKTMPTSPGGPVRLTLREEVIAPSYVDTVGGRSSLMSMEVHCEERRLRMDERRLYSGLSLSGAMEVSEPSAEWFKIPEGSIMDQVAQAACDAQYAWPLRIGGRQPGAANIQVAAADAPVMTLPPGPDAKPVPDEPPPAEIVVVPPELAPAVEPPPSEIAPPAAPPDAQPASEPVSPAPAIEAESLSSTPTGPATPALPAVEATLPEAAPPDPPPPQVRDPSEPLTPQPEPLVAAAEQSIPASDTSAPPVAAMEAAPVATPPLPEPVEAASRLESAPADEPDAPKFAVQIGAYETEEMAQAAWAALAANRPILVEGLSFEIRQARVNGKDWRRGLVGPFATRGAAGAFCTALAGSEYGCILRSLAD